MSANLVTESITIGTTVLQFPPGTGAVNHIVVTITGTAVGNTTPIVQTIPFANVGMAGSLPLSADTYTWSIQNFDANNTPLAGAFTGTHTVVAPATVSVTIANTLTFTP